MEQYIEDSSELNGDSESGTDIVLSEHSEPKSRRGGRRPGAGRKPKDLSELKRNFNRIATDLIVECLPDLLKAMKRLALGGYEVIEETWEPAGLVMVDRYERDSEGRIRIDSSGKQIKIKRQAYPNMHPDELVMVSRKVIIASPDREAAKYLIDRVLGKPKQSLELGGSDGAAIPIAVENAINKIYGSGRDSEIP